MQTTLDDIQMIKIDITGWIGIRDDNGKRHDVCVKKFLVDKKARKLRITGHNGVWIVDVDRIDFTF